MKDYSGDLAIIKTLSTPRKIGREVEARFIAALRSVHDSQPKAWQTWAEAWIDGSDRSPESALRASMASERAAPESPCEDRDKALSGSYLAAAILEGPDGPDAALRAALNDCDSALRWGARTNPAHSDRETLNAEATA